MTGTKKVTWQARDGRSVEVTITKTREVQDKTVNLDGDSINLGKETVDSLNIEVNVNGEIKTRSYNAPDVITERFYRNYKQLKAAGAYAKLGDVFINEEQYNLVMSAINELEAEVVGGAEFTEVKAYEEVKEAKEQKELEAEAEYHAKLVKRGLCPKCGTWCYGDCEAN